MTLAEMEAYADRQLRRYDLRLFWVRAEQDWQTPDVPYGRVYRLEQLAQRIIRRRDAFYVRVVGTLDPVHYT